MPIIDRDREDLSADSFSDKTGNIVREYLASFLPLLAVFVACGHSRLVISGGLTRITMCNHGCRERARPIINAAMLVGRINNANNTLRPATIPLPPSFSPTHSLSLSLSLSLTPRKLAPFHAQPRYSSLITRLLEHLEYLNYLSETNGPEPLI